jgi:hypothetical protein
MSLIQTMTLFNITHDESSSVDIGGNWIEQDQCHVALRFNEDDQEDIEFHMLLGRENLEILRDFLNEKIAEQNRTIN